MRKPPLHCDHCNIEIECTTYILTGKSHSMNIDLCKECKILFRNLVMNFMIQVEFYDENGEREYAQ
jgi:hypothetical protein